MINLFLITEYCDPPPYIDHAIVTSYNNTLFGHTELKCMPGYRFKDGSQLQRLECTDYGWMPDSIITCEGNLEGRFNFSYVYIYI